MQEELGLYPRLGEKVMDSMAEVLEHQNKRLIVGGSCSKS